MIKAIRMLLTGHLKIMNQEEVKPTLTQLLVRLQSLKESL